MLSNSYKCLKIVSVIFFPKKIRPTGTPTLLQSSPRTTTKEPRIGRGLTCPTFGKGGYSRQRASNKSKTNGGISNDQLILITISPTFMLYPSGSGRYLYFHLLSPEPSLLQSIDLIHAIQRTMLWNIGASMTCLGSGGFSV